MSVLDLQGLSLTTEHGGKGGGHGGGPSEISLLLCLGDDGGSELSLVLC